MADLAGSVRPTANPAAAPGDEVRTVERASWYDEVAALYADPLLAFDWLSACDEIGQADELRVVLRLDRLDGSGVRLETRVPRDEPLLRSVRDLVAGAEWHERETAELYGVTFLSPDGTPLPSRPLLLPGPGQPGHPGGWPLRKDYVLAARAVTPWPADAGGAEDARRRQAPAGVPDPAVWGSRPADAGPPDPAEVVAPPGRRRR
ncbi:MAG TPA: NADH-quinone oxidoreductase subunit C [Propionibacteriaceae bacterium]|nr:NADH-quinone oxidoreductase subunit C [Propionibacteriaceae bacterium]